MDKRLVLSTYQADLLNLGGRSIILARMTVFSMVFKIAMILLVLIIISQIGPLPRITLEL